MALNGYSSLLLSCNKAVVHSQLCMGRRDRPQWPILCRFGTNRLSALLSFATTLYKASVRAAVSRTLLTSEARGVVQSELLGI